jgi:hypothetical protein
MVLAPMFISIMRVSLRVYWLSSTTRMPRSSISFSICLADIDLQALWIGLPVLARLDLPFA